MAEEKTTGCGCGAGSSCCGSDTEPVKPESKESCCGGSVSEGSIRDTACCDPGAAPDASRIRKVSLVLLLLFAAVVLIHGLLNRDTGVDTPDDAPAGEVRD